MASKPRRELIDDDRVGTYHCFVQAVRQAFLMGDCLSDGKDYSHRQRWVRERVAALGSVFSIDVVDYAAMSNHMHLILRNRPDVLETWSDEEVVRRWLRLNRHTLQLKRPAPEKKVKSWLAQPGKVAKIRARLKSISWFMAYLNQPIANEANLEDGKSGHFWADRFGSVELEDEETRLACLLYVDLNRVRAGAAAAPERAEFTGIYDRMRDRIEQMRDRRHSGWMIPLSRQGDGYEGAAARRRASDTGFLPMTEDDYLAMLDAEGRHEAPGKRGWISANLPPILERLELSAARWESAVRLTNRRFERIRRKADAQADSGTAEAGGSESTSDGPKPS